MYIYIYNLTVTAVETVSSIDKASVVGVRHDHIALAIHRRLVLCLLLEIIEIAHLRRNGRAQTRRLGANGRLSQRVDARATQQGGCKALDGHSQHRSHRHFEDHLCHQPTLAISPSISTHGSTDFSWTVQSHTVLNALTGCITQSLCPLCYTHSSSTWLRFPLGLVISLFTDNDINRMLDSDSVRR